jgi:hypothetical protein
MDTDPHAALRAQYEIDRKHYKQPWKLWQFALSDSVPYEWHQCLTIPMWYGEFVYRRLPTAPPVYPDAPGTDMDKPRTGGEVYDGLFSEINDCRGKAVMLGVKTPELRTCVSQVAWERLCRYIEENFSMVTIPHDGQGEIYFCGSTVTVVPGEDIYFKTRCTNLKGN